MPSSSIKPHPYIPLIKIGTVADYARRAGHHKDPLYLASADDEQMWTFRIEGNDDISCYESREAATEAAERIFFFSHNRSADLLLEQAFARQHFDHVVKLAERRGYWLGRLYKLEHHAELAKSLINQLELLTHN